MTNRSSPFKWKYEKIVDREVDAEIYDRLLEDDDQRSSANSHGSEYDPVPGSSSLQDEASLQFEPQEDSETIIDDLKFSKDYYELKKRSQHEKKLNNLDNHHYLFHRIEKGDTLQGIALKYYCSLHELKRVNNLVSDQDFYGLNVIKIPVKKYGILSEVMVHQVNSSYLTLLDESPQETNQSLIINVGLRQTFSNDDNAQDMNQFLNNLDADLAKMRKVVGHYGQNGDEGSSASTSTSIVNGTSSTLHSTSPVTHGPSSSNYQFDGADCGFSWYTLILVALFLLILVPVIYAFLFENSHPFELSLNREHPNP